MNMGIKKAKGDYVIWLDAHAEYPTNYISDLIKYVDIIRIILGGNWITETKAKTLKSWAIKKALSHKFGVGNSAFRIGATKPQIVDTVPFGCFKRDVFDQFGLYDERLERNQDIEFNKRIKKGKFFWFRKLRVRILLAILSGLFNNNYKNGYWNILTVYYTKKLFFSIDTTFCFGFRFITYSSFLTCFN